jgi:ABC-type transport system involved in cytochrome c biogenesis permease subunit
MPKMSEYAFVASMLATGLAIVFYIMYAVSGLRAARMQTAGGPSTGSSLSLMSGPRTAAIGRYATMIATHHGPFANMYEFSMAFAFGVLATYMWFERKYHQRILALVALPIALAMMLYAATIPADIEPLVPALQNNLLLTVHVAVAIVAYGSFAIAFAASVLYLLQPSGGRWGLPKPQVLDEMGYRAVVVGFPFLTLTIILGAVWANTAWGTYWSWDPKETASLVTWFIYAAYLHARVMRGWRGNRAAWLLVLGFAATLFTYFGNLFFGGLHSYSGLG